MIDTTATDENTSANSGPLYDYIILGQDSIGDLHVYRTKDGTVFVLDTAGEPVDRTHLAGRPLHDYKERIDGKQGWHDYDPHVPTEDDWTAWALREA